MGDYRRCNSAVSHPPIDLRRSSKDRSQLLRCQPVVGRSETHVVPILTSGISALPSFNPALTTSVLALRTLTRDGIPFGLFQPIPQDPIDEFWLLNC